MDWNLGPLRIRGEAALAAALVIGLGVSPGTAARVRADAHSQNQSSPQAQSTGSADLSRARAALLEAERLIDAGQLQPGVTKAAESLALYRALPDEHAMAVLGRGDANYLLGKAFRTNKEDDRASEYWAAAIAQYQRLTGRTASERLLAVLEELVPVLDRLGRDADLLKVLAMTPALQTELGRPAVDQAETRRNLAVLLMRAGRSREAAFQGEQALELAAQAKMPARKMADYLYTLGLVENRIGSVRPAAEHFRRALALLEPLPDTGAQRAEILLDLANALEAAGSPADARRELDRALRLVDKDPAAELMKAKLLVNIANDDFDRLKKVEDISAYREVLRITAGKKGAEKIEAAALLNIANHLGKTGRIEEAIGMYRDLLGRQVAASAEIHDINTTRRNLGLTLARVGRPAEALPPLLDGLRAQWSSLAADLPALTRYQKVLEVSEVADYVHPIYGIAFSDWGGGGLAYEAALLTKALFSEATRVERAVGTPARSGGSSARHERYLELRRELSRRTIQQSGAASNGETTALAKEAQEIERELRRDPSVFRPDARLAPTRLADVRSRLRPGEVLLEYVAYTTYKLPEWREGDLHYGVFVLDGRTGVVTAVDLGPRSAIDDLIAAFRDREARQADPVTGKLDEAELARAADVVRARILDPALQGQPRPTRIYVAPDALIGLVPFEALPAGRPSGAWRYLIEDTEVVYLLTGRDLARRENMAAQTGQDVWLVGDPAFDATPQRRMSVPVGPPPPGVPATAASATAAPPSGRRVVAGASDQAGDRESEVPSDWLRLDATRDIVLAAAVATERAGLTPRVLLDVAASEDNAYVIRRPRILMFATHGYFMSSMPTVSLNISSTADAPGTVNEDLFETADPLHRSMLVLAGANQRNHRLMRYAVNGQLISPADAKQRGLTPAELALAQRELGDGLLTAYEIMDMDLAGTELVLLTACESGLGVAQGSAASGLRQADGEGVAGMRQAFAIAGARSLVMSMWQVPVDQSALQMRTFLDGWLSRRAPRYQAFRASQLAALAAARKQTGGGHPFWWAGFVYIGDPADR